MKVRIVGPACHRLAHSDPAVSLRGVWELLRTRRWLSFTAAAIAAIVAFGVLSQWQWQRAQEEKAESAIVLAGAAAEPEPITSLLAPGSELPAEQEWRTVTATGSLDCELGFLVRNRPISGTNGLWATCPLTTADGALLWVNRGWLPVAGAATTVIPMPEGPTGEVSVTGRLRLSEDAGPNPPTDLPTGQVSHLDTALLTTTIGHLGPAFSAYVEVTSLDPADPAGLQRLPLPPEDSAQNFSYAGQWLLFAAIAIGGWFYFLRREAREVAAESGADQEPQLEPDHSVG